ncbi:CPBP family glutamic-type intramembrane protease [Staphylococcus equorum]|uniref:CPBP family glutamic-type intramembrane protease n=1 Tax=Staphylococcus equorum TaxID=246432 RepID=UPI003CE7B2D0
MNKIEAIVISTLLIVVSGVSLNIMLMLSVSILDNSSTLIYYIIFTLIFIISFIGLPTLLVNYLFKKHLRIWFLQIFNYKRLIFMFIIILPFSLFLIGKAATTEYFIVAICEEFLFRHILLILLLSVFNKSSSFILGSFLFSLILHINGDLIVNLCTKFPSSLIMYWLEDKYKLQDAIAFHWLYNILIYKFS